MRHTTTISVSAQLIQRLICQEPALSKRCWCYISRLRLAAPVPRLVSSLHLNHGAISFFIPLVAFNLTTRLTYGTLGKLGEFDRTDLRVGTALTLY